MTIRAPPALRSRVNNPMDELFSSQTSLYPGLFSSEAVEEWRASQAPHVRSNLRNKKVSNLPGHFVLRDSSPVSSAHSASESETKYDLRTQSLLLCQHILTRGLMDGIGSDVVVHVPAWDKTYNLHRLILDQNPYFRMLLEGDFMEGKAKSVTLHFENNPFITAESFYFVLTQLYGKLFDPPITEDNVRQILATCSFFQLEHTCRLCVDFMRRTLHERNVVDYLVFADTYNVHGSEAILDAVFTFLCREAYFMSTECLVDLPIHWIEKVLKSDAFWVPSEYDRYQFVFQLLKNRYAHLQPSEITSTPTDTQASSSPEPEPQQIDLLAGECADDLCASDDLYLAGVDLKRSSIQPSPNTSTLEDDATQADSEEEIQAFEGMIGAIHFMYMTFEQLVSIQNDINPWTKQTVVPDSVMKNALWQQIDLRAKIEAAHPRDVSLGLTVLASQATGEMYRIPTDDMTTYSGDAGVVWLPDQRSKRDPSVRPPSNHSDRQGDGLNDGLEGDLYAIYPPFRFSVEFADFASLKQNVRVYSKTVFYAGSEWNMYIQKTRSQRKSVLQLGVYLHRQATSVVSRQDDNTASPQTSHRKNNTFSQYTDKRKIVRTWFKIICMSRGPRHAMTLFQSSADKFSVLQSWGWRSTTLCADESMDTMVASDILREKTEGTDVQPRIDTSFIDLPPFTPTPISPGNVLDLGVADIPTAAIKSGSTLRFSVVMGHV